ncbi:GRIP-related Arf-binding domain protein [Kalmanozyma brasiliensis GHG001]|uniref:GRIP domain-containing protein n=1 Tax=Kalmanozyma brasiliensis (strain GHG001) TaxID=1365824 RepID=V5GG64_KALBG|nr:GRIP-related Arf-binding domain protein [Kalmanozyma brasiliensis GHG001]EST05017.1 GRIP-related Arf-binding domain protein [Kalmanozyma brasiliensis GHG001]
MSAPEASSSSTGRPSLDASSAAPASTNGTTTSTLESGTEESWAPISSMSDSAIRTELLRVREERDTFESQYRSLLSKLTTMRATLGDRLRQDAEELDRRETQIDTLTSTISNLESSLSTLRAELVSSHGETDRLANEVDALRKSLVAKEEMSGGGRELQEQLERVKVDAHGWQTRCLEERAVKEELESRLAEARDEVVRAQAAEVHYRGVAERESASAANLSSVLSEFQSSQESELQRALGDHRDQLDRLTTANQEWRSRAEEAESQLHQNANLTSQAETLAASVKEKNLLIGKLRHEAVILNEHLTEALRRLRNHQMEGSVDKRLVTNLLLQFISTPRADGKRYEMLSLIAGVLEWGAEEREAAGLQKGGGTQRPGMGARGTSSGRRVSGGAVAGNGVGGDESFSNLFVEFLLSEAERGKEGKKEGEEALTSPTSPGLPKRLFSPTGERMEPLSPSKSDAGGRGEVSAATSTNGEEAPNSKSAGGGGFGSYFGLSRASKK